MTELRLPLVAQQARPPFPNQVDSDLQIRLRLGGSQVAGEDVPELSHPALPRGFPAFLRIAEPHQMDVTHSCVKDGLSQLLFGEPRPSRRRHLANVN